MLLAPLLSSMMGADIFFEITNKEKQKQNLNIIIEETDRLTILVNDILELSKIQSTIGTLKYLPLY